MSHIKSMPAAIKNGATEVESHQNNQYIFNFVKTASGENNNPEQARGYC
jgi:hypothetical protein